ncbi:bacterial virulence protein virb8 [Lucifera butyrica]|uniref:Bacterial virulence protein virb8 n=1 Tax=Lucifera butyrica TaxID=1351585 RepID=A0A498RBW5_9FIRM|nr:conjugal transfer protein TrbF [Lucifera butyrica]VBB08475.1 bacterial virulence protein virb8 [Lucifera butyrica]
MSAKELTARVEDYKPDAPPVSPYDAPKQIWDHLLGSAKVEAYSWKIGFFTVLVFLGFSIAGNVYMGSRSSFIPYVVQLNSEGAPKAVGPARETNFKPGEREINYFLCQFVKNIRSISLDPVRTTQDWEASYAYLRPAAANKMNQIMNDEDPSAKLGKETVAVTVRSFGAVPSSGNTYQVRWTEVVYAKDGTRKATRNMTGLFTVATDPPKTEQDILNNPLGLKIADFSWSPDI